MNARALPRASSDADSMAPAADARAVHAHPPPEGAPARRGVSADRRIFLRATCGVAAWVTLRPASGQSRLELDAAVRAFAAGLPIREGKVTFDVAPLVENGNAVPITVSVDSPMTAADHVRNIAVFNEKNPQRDVAVFTLGPRSGRARVATRIRLATSQRLVAVARLSDGSCWQQGVDVIVTLAACVES